MIVRPRKLAIELAPNIRIPEWADEKAREIAHDKRWDYYVFRDKWVHFAKQETLKGNAPKDAGVAFVAWANKQGNAP